ncbi:unnamed protein product [Protopolystoma xenopodis]|uniref:Uncharacterized protein n=1 Tax=Protopolystoma xenopodis TaxID=117903 RepID=A0A448WZQ7_9PLAT|nr:unnamed protein product [Protopolystoma xenopodis]
MLFSVCREDEGWDVSVHKSILLLTCSLVCRPIDENEHPDHPIPASTVFRSNEHSGLSASSLGGPFTVNGATGSSPTRCSSPSSGQSGLFRTPTRLSITNQCRQTSLTAQSSPSVSLHPMSRKRRHDEMMAMSASAQVTTPQNQHQVHQPLFQQSTHQTDLLLNQPLQISTAVTGFSRFPPRPPSTPPPSSLHGMPISHPMTIVPSDPLVPSVYEKARPTHLFYK